MSVGFNEAMEQLQAMFTDFDKETIKMMLVQNSKREYSAPDECD